MMLVSHSLDEQPDAIWLFVFVGGSLPLSDQHTGLVAGQSTTSTLFFPASNTIGRCRMQVYERAEG
jgi:hypothetical protein